VEVNIYSLQRDYFSGMINILQFHGDYAPRMITGIESQ
jgi:hypothetical protein